MTWVGLDTADITIANLTFTSTGGFNIFGRNATTLRTLTITDTFATAASTQLLTLRNSTGTLALVTNNLALGAGSQLHLGGIDGVLSSVTVTGGTTIGNNARLGVRAETARFANITLDTAATFWLNQHNAVAGASTRTVAVASLTSTSHTAKIAAANTSTNNAGLNAILHINGATGVTTFGGQLRDNIVDSATDLGSQLSLLKTNDGTQILSVVSGSDGRNNTYTGTTTISGGKLVVNHNHVNAGAYTINNSGTLAGTATITTANNAGITLSENGKLAPGDNGVGTLTFALGDGDTGGGALDLSAAGADALQFTLGANGVNTSVALTSGALAIGDGALGLPNFSFTTNAGFGEGASYTLFSSSQTITGTLNAATASGIVNGHLATLALNGNDIVLNIGALAPAIPEPATLALLASAGAALAAVFAKQRRN
ncbi:MAG: PEP-CTERM sorting domain-containing protein [Opitutaceae bacterium]|nr:PEP-CTERM sorting domain-containing protein [Opitutaceae bacterium]